MRNRTPEEIASQLQSLWGIDVNIYDVISWTSRCLQQIGNISLQRKWVVLKVENYRAEVPCDLYRINSVTGLEPGLIPRGYNYEITYGYEVPFNKFLFVGEDTSSTAQVPVGEDTPFKYNAPPKITGPYIDYTYTHPYININWETLDIYLEYQAYETDEQGRVVIPDRAFDACLYFCAYVIQERKLMMGLVNPNVFSKIEQLKNQAILRARTGDISSNKLNKALDELTSWDRKRYGKDA